MHPFRRPSLLVVALALGCALTKPDPELDAFGRRTIQLFASGDSAALAASLDPSLTTSTTWGKITEVHDSLATFHGDSTALIGWNIVASPNSYRADLTYELHGQGWALVTAAVVRRQGSLVVNGFHFQRSTGSLAQLNAFTLDGRSWKHYAVLILALGCLLIALASAAIVVRTRMPRRWLWAFVALCGVGQVGINWSTGELFINPIRWQLLCAAYFRPGFVGPWIVSFALPVGAALALWRRHVYLGARPATTPPAPAA
jgi:hypothetical protein